MLTKFICLANSNKEGGRCIAGIEVDEKNNPVFINGKPKWIRPVCKTNHGQVPTNFVEPFKLLDIIELDVTEQKPENYQSENVLFNEKSFKTVGTFNRNELKNLCSNDSIIFGNKKNAISQEEILSLNHSLMLVSVNKFDVDEKEKPNGVPQVRLTFSIGEIEYDFPVTDPVLISIMKMPTCFMI